MTNLSFQENDVEGSTSLRQPVPEANEEDAFNFIFLSLTKLWHEIIDFKCKFTGYLL